MMKNIVLIVSFLLLPFSSFSQIGHRFPSEMKVVRDPVTGVELVFLTSKSGMGDRKTYQTHNQWTSDGRWCVFNSRRANGEAIAVNEETGEMVQVTEGGYAGKLLLARKSMKMFFLRKLPIEQRKKNVLLSNSHPYEIVEMDLGAVFADSEAGKMKDVSVYERICGDIPAEMGVGGDIALDATEKVAYFRVGKEEAAKYLPAGTKLEEGFGPKNKGTGPTGIASMNLETGELKHVISLPFETGHVQANPWVPGEIIFCWETGGKAPQRTWMVNADGTGLRPVYRETAYDWVTHEAVITRDEVAIAILGHRPIREDYDAPVVDYVFDPTNPGQEPGWGPSGTREKATGLAIVNLRTRNFTLAGQIPFGSGFWHVNGSADGNWAVGDDFDRNIYLIDRHTGELILLSAGHKKTAADHPHPTFSSDGTKIHIQSAMLSDDGISMNICVIRLPQELVNRYKK